MSCWASRRMRRAAKFARRSARYVCRSLPRLCLTKTSTGRVPWTPSSRALPRGFGRFHSRGGPQAALENHPDRGGDADLFQAINKAYDVLSDSERRKYYERTGRLEKSVEEEFLEGFGKKGKKQTAGEQQHAPVDNSEALAERFTDLAEQSHSKSFDAWMRSRDQKSMTLTQDHFMTKEYLVGDTYEKEPIPADAKATTVTARSTGPDLSANTAIGRTRLPKELEWRELLVNVAAAPLSPLDQYVGRAGASALMNEDVDLKTPHTLGFAGIGIVEAVGEGCKDVTVGDWVLPNRDGLGTFTSLTVWDEADVMKVPKELMPLEYMAVHRELCVAYYLLEEYSSTLKVRGRACRGKQEQKRKKRRPDSAPAHPSLSFLSPGTRALSTLPTGRWARPSCSCAG